MDVAVRYWIYFSVISRVCLILAMMGAGDIYFSCTAIVIAIIELMCFLFILYSRYNNYWWLRIVIDRPWHIGNKGSWWFLLLHQPLCYQDYHLHSNSPTVLSQKCLNFIIRILCITTLYCVKLPDSATQIFMCWIILAMKGAGVLPIAPVPLLPKLLKRTIFVIFWCVYLYRHRLICLATLIILDAMQYIWIFW